MVDLSTLLMDAFRRNDNSLIIKHIDEFFSLYKTEELNECLVKACLFGNQTIIKKLLGQEDIAKYIGFGHLKNRALDCILNRASQSGNLETLRFILFSPELVKRPTIDFNTLHSCFKDKRRIDIIKFFIFEVGIPNNSDIKKLLQTYPNQEIEDCFNARDLAIQLNKELPDERKYNKPNKSKI